MFEAQCVVILCLVVTIRCMEGYIVGGELASINQFPYCAFIRPTCSGPSTHQWTCGSSILNQDILLTAAHCLDCETTLTISINVGSSFNNKGHKTMSRFYVHHERFNMDTLINDIGLVRVKNRIPLNAVASRVALMKNPPPIVEAEVAGWGLINEKNPALIDHLKHLNQKLVKKYKCEEIYGKLPAGQLCAWFNNYEFPSLGDSGSALVANGYIQIGIVSYKTPSLTNSLIVYTDVSYYTDWIQKITKKLYCKQK